MKTQTNTITGAIKDLTVIYSTSTFTNGKIVAAFGKIYWKGKYTKKQVSINYFKVKENLLCKPTDEDVLDALYQKAIDTLYDIKNQFGNPVYLLS